MEYMTRQSIFDTLAKTVSVLFHPLLVTFYGMLIIVLAPTLFGFLPPEIKKILLLIVFINNVLIPISLIPYFRYRKIISSWVMISRQERIIPIFVTTFFYFITVSIFLRFQIPVFIKAFLLMAAILALALAIINFRLRISIHSAGAGALLALVFILSVQMQVALTWYLIPAILGAGAILSSRVWLNSHTPGEVWSGFFLGVAATALMLVIS